MYEEYVKIGKIDINKYSQLCKNKIISDEVIITYKQIQHINERRLGIYEKYKDNLKDIIKNPNYIIIDPKHDETGLVIKEYDKNVVVVLNSTLMKKIRKIQLLQFGRLSTKD